MTGGCHGTLKREEGGETEEKEEDRGETLNLSLWIRKIEQKEKSQKKSGGRKSQFLQQKFSRMVGRWDRAACGYGFCF